MNHANDYPTTSRMYESKDIQKEKLFEVQARGKTH